MYSVVVKILSFLSKFICPTACLLWGTTCWGSKKVENPLAKSMVLARIGSRGTRKIEDFAWFISSNLATINPQRLLYKCII